MEKQGLLILSEHFLLLLATIFLAFIVSSSSGYFQPAPRGQGEALTKLIFDQSKHLRRAPYRHAFRSSGTISNTVVVDNSKTYPQEGSKEKDRIVKLPGQPDGVDFYQYSGYVTVDATAGRALFYYFAEAAGSDQASKPLLLWLNGGPGCSSIGYGAMEELGPFRVASDGKTLYRNPYAWITVANVLFLESPAGVGFSYSNNTVDYVRFGDKKTAADSYAFLLNWFERFPEYKGKDFYIAGESYAGHYVPQLAEVILQQKNPNIALEGIMIGNAVINEETDNRGMYDYFWTHALISDESIDMIHKFCNFSPAVENARLNNQCAQGLLDAFFNVNIKLNIYNIYAPKCSSNGVTSTPNVHLIENYDPCTDNYVAAYLNDHEVQQALHANVTKLGHPWSSCSAVISTWNDSSDSVLPLLKKFISNGIRVWVYSGDIDGRVPVTSTRYSLNLLKLRINTSWRPWIINGEVGGYTAIYQGNLTFATVRGAGHEVPSYQPARASVLVKSFIEGVPLPSS